MLCARSLKRTGERFGIVRKATCPKASTRRIRQFALRGEQGKALPVIHEPFDAAFAQKTCAFGVCAGNGDSLPRRSRSQARAFQHERGKRKAQDLPFRSVFPNAGAQAVSLLCAKDSTRVCKTYLISTLSVP